MRGWCGLRLGRGRQGLEGARPELGWEAGPGGRRDMLRFIGGNYVIPAVTEE